jgi:GntR family carbon starvation induced transcriptional regulator
VTYEIDLEEHDGTPLATNRTSSGIGVYRKLRRDIVRARWLPGARLRFKELRGFYKVGVSPLREALMKLASDGLVELEGYKGFRVAPVSKTGLLDIINMRKELESMAIRLSIEHATDHWEAGIVAAMHELGKREILGSDGLMDDEWEQRHRAFHTSLTAACGSEWLARFRLQLYDQADRYRRLSEAYSTAPRDTIGEHRAMMEAAIAHDIPTAVYLIRRHLDLTCQILLSADKLIFGGK